MTQPLCCLAEWLTFNRRSPRSSSRCRSRTGIGEQLKLTEDGQISLADPDACSMVTSRDLTPGPFGSLHAVRDPGYNVENWNLCQREVKADLQGTLRVNEETAGFFDFSRLGPVVDTLTQMYARGNFEVHELWFRYRRQASRF